MAHGDTNHWVSHNTKNAPLLWLRSSAPQEQRRPESQHGLGLPRSSRLPSALLASSLIRSQSTGLQVTAITQSSWQTKRINGASMWGRFRSSMMAINTVSCSGNIESHSAWISTAAPVLSLEYAIAQTASRFISIFSLAQVDLLAPAIKPELDSSHAF